jgi:integrase
MKGGSFMGSIYKRGKTYWVQYYNNGKKYAESSKSHKKMVATQLLKKREGEISQGKLPGIHFDKVTFVELADEFLDDYLINQKKSLPRAQRSVNHLKRTFEHFSIPAITTPRIKEYIKSRLDEGAANATINRELSALKRMLNLGAQQTPPKVDRVAHIPMLEENNIRKGFFEPGDYMTLRDALADYLRPYVIFAYKVGWRDSEISGLTWNKVFLDRGYVRLETGETKNKEARTVFLDKELMEIFHSQKENQRRSGKLSNYVFPNEDGTNRIKDFRGTWNNACRLAGLGYGYRTSKRYVAKWEKKLPAGPILHDFRRTAVRNLVRAGISEPVAMKISGHKTRSVFDRYNIVSESDLRDAARAAEKFLSETATKTATIVDFDKKKEK